MLSFDLETTDVSWKTGDITCACAYDPDAGVSKSFVFPLGDDPEEFMALLDGAERLCAFNGVRFDLRFMAAKWAVPDERVGRWVRKMFDPFESCKLALNRTFKLDALLAHNGIEVKISHGSLAVQMAKDEEWDRLREYCMDDTVKTHRVCSLESMQLPLQDRALKLRGVCWQVVADTAQYKPPVDLKQYSKSNFR